MDSPAKPFTTKSDMLLDVKAETPEQNFHVKLAKIK
jgi:hypothetical protein